MSKIAMYKVQLKKLGSVDNPFVEESLQYVKKDEVKDLISNTLPEEGQEYYASYENSFRHFRTSTVKKVLSKINEGFNDKKIIFETWNSRYQLDIIDTIMTKDDE